jgi:NADP-dependent 3-hydroxy acid dehydrogenase YdfG
MCFSHSPERLLKSYNTNIFGHYNVTRALLPHMREKKSGVIGFVGSQVSVHLLEFLSSS